MTPGTASSSINKVVALGGCAVRRAMHYFPERQIYIRSAGHIQFYKLGAVPQVIAACFAAMLLTWASFATVVVVFKDRIMEAEDYRYQQTENSLEDKIASLQVSYDELVVSAAKSQAHADRQLAALEEHQKRLMSQARYVVDDHRATVSSKPVLEESSRAPSWSFIGRVFGWFAPAHDQGIRPWHQSSLDRLRYAVASLRKLSESSNSMMAAIENDTLRGLEGEKGLIARTGISAEQFLRKLESAEGVGGPEVPLDGIPLDGIPDKGFTQSYFRAEANLNELTSLMKAMKRIPTAAPLSAIVGPSSGFGPRLDPFSGRYAFHPGIDFAGPSGTPVLATASGRVTFAGRDGSYGNMVEIDHGYGLKTRYAHLLDVTVTKGQAVIKGATVGRLGSTGRSTGPHVHYEVWYENSVRNPDSFLRIGRFTIEDTCKVIACSGR